MAEAIQVASRYEASPISAVTSPPVPRLTSPPGWNVTGPRFDTSTSGDFEPITDSYPEPLKQLEPVAQEPRRQKALPGRLLAGASELLAQTRVGQDLERALGALLDG